MKKVAPEKKVTVLSDIRNTEENRQFFDLNKYTPFNMKEVENISPSAKGIKTNQNTQKKRKLVNKNQKPQKKRKTKHESSTDEDTYSLHDSSEYYISDDDEYTVTKQTEELSENKYESEIKQKNRQKAKKWNIHVIKTQIQVGKGQIMRQ